MNSVIQNRTPGMDEADSFGLNPRQCSFKPEEYAITIKDESGNESLYLEVKYRVLWFQIYCREQHIGSYSIESDKAETVGNRYIQVAARVRINGEVIGSDIGGVYISNNDSFYAVQRAATMAKGRALANAGFGAAFASDSSESLPEQPCDSGYPVGEKKQTQISTVESVQLLSPMEQVKAQNFKPQPVVPAEEPVNETKETQKSPMTLEEAKNFVIPSGSQRGRTLEQAGMQAAEYFSSERFRGKDIYTAANLLLESKKSVR